MRLQMETLDDPIFIEDYGDSICVEGDQSCLLNLSIEQASQLSEILRVWVAKFEGVLEEQGDTK